MASTIDHLTFVENCICYIVNKDVESSAMHLRPTQDAEMKNIRQFPFPQSARIDSTVGLPRGCRQSNGLKRISWRRTLDWLALPALRLHQYRNIHTQMLRSALCVVDCGNSRQEKTESRNE